MTAGRGTAAPATLVCIRGNSGSGKSTIALKLRQAYGRGLAIVEQDYIRRQLLHEKDQAGAANIDLIGIVVRHALGAGYHTVLEGILDAGHYGAMLDALHREHGGPQYWYYLDIPYDQTLLRHATKPNAHAFGATQMARWYNPGDLLPGGRERVIGADSTAEQSVYTILADTQLLGTTVHLPLGRPDLPHATPGADGDRLRAALVERLEAEAGLTDPLLRAAFAVVRRELVVPRGYAPRAEVSGTEERVWQLLDGLHPSDRDEWLSLVYGGQSVILHLPGQDPRTAPRGHLAVGGGFASMTTDATGAVHLLEPLTVTRGTRVLEAGTGAGLVAALLCEITGPEQVTSIEVDPLLAQATGERLAAAGYQPRLLTGDALAGCPGEEFDAIVLSFSVRSVPVALLEQLVVGGMLIAPIHAGSPSWPAHCHVTRTESGWDAVLRPYARGAAAPGAGQDYHRPPKPGTAPDQPDLGRRRESRIAVPDPQGGAGFWLAVGHVLAIMRGAAPGEEQWALHHRATGSRALLTPVGEGWQVDWWGDHDLWADVEELHRRWEQAGCPAEYRLDLSDPAQQTVLGATSGHPLIWVLPGNPLAPAARMPPSPERTRTA